MTVMTGTLPVMERQALRDGCGRCIDHLRLSLTDRCSLACRYCREPDKQPNPHFMDPEFAVALVRWLSTRHGVDHVRLTGGEPLLYPHLVPLVRRLSRLGTLAEITLTTNAQALSARAVPLRAAGLTRVNISLDSLDPTRFAQMARGGCVAHTLRGIDAAIAAGLTPVRLNAVVQRGWNDGEVGDLLEWAIVHGCTMRFLEVMPIGPSVARLQQDLVPAAEILERLGRRFHLEPIHTPAGQPANEYAVRRPRSTEIIGVVGVIASTTQPFCEHCRRIRITARGELRACLFDPAGPSLTAAWDGASLDEDGADHILYATVMAKLPVGVRSQHTPMVQIGG